MAAEGEGVAPGRLLGLRVWGGVAGAWGLFGVRRGPETRLSSPWESGESRRCKRAVAASSLAWTLAKRGSRTGGGLNPVEELSMAGDDQAPRWTAVFGAGIWPCSLS